MAKPMQLGHTNIRVSNLARSEAFYTEAIGLELSAAGRMALT